MEQSKYLVLHGTTISFYNRKDIIEYDLSLYRDNECRIFELRKGIMRDVYLEIKLGDIK
jgi:hypothetical protein